MYYPCSENKGADQLRGYREADLRLCFRICKNRFSYNESHMFVSYFYFFEFNVLTVTTPISVTSNQTALGFCTLSQMLVVEISICLPRKCLWRHKKAMFNKLIMSTCRDMGPCIHCNGFSAESLTCHNFYDEGFLINVYRRWIYRRTVPWDFSHS